MEIEQAEVILNTITVGAGALWLAGTWFVVRSGQIGKVRVPPEPQPLRVHDATVPRAVFGTDDIEGIPAENQSKALSALATGVGHDLGTLRIVEQTPGYLCFESAGSGSLRTGGLPRFGKGEIWFSMQTGGNTHVDYAVELKTGGGLLGWARVMNVVGLAAIVTGYLAVSKWIIPDHALRPQVFQMAQTVHLLWPPFLLGALYRHQYTQIAGRIATFVHNLPYLSGT